MDGAATFFRFYCHVVAGSAGEGRQLLARLALHMAGEGSLQTRELAELGRMSRVVPSSCENELMAADFIKECIISGAPEWTPEQREKLRTLAGSVGQAMPLSLVRS